MQGYGILMIIFGSVLSLSGLYIYTGHNSELLLWKGYNKNTTKKQLKQIGKYIIAVSISLIISGICGLFYQEENIIPVIVLLVSLILSIIIAKK